MEGKQVTQKAAITKAWQLVIHDFTHHTYPLQLMIEDIK